ncbi:MAG: sulfotransferase [Flexibacteraceae bacterium]
MKWWEKPGHQPILVTGAVRSGTTFVGKVLAETEGAIYVSEPFNIHNKKVYDTNWENQWTYLTDADKPAYYKKLCNAFKLEAVAKSPLSLNGIRAFLHDMALSFVGSPERVIIKDPIALASTNFIHKHFNAKVVLCVRHPAGFVQSMQKLNWLADPNYFLNQPALVERYLSSIKAELEAYKHVTEPNIEVNALGWKAQNLIVKQLLDENSSFILLKHEKLSNNPIETFKDLLDELKLPLTSDLELFIKNHTSSNNPEQTSSNQPHTIKLNAKANSQGWKKKLTSHEISTIKAITEPVASYFYNETEW